MIFRITAGGYPSLSGLESGECDIETGSVNHRIGLAILLISALLLPTFGFSASNTNGLPNPGRIVFLGDSITYSGEYVAYLEAYLLTHFPERRYEIIDVGLPSETVSGLSEPGHAGGAFPRPNLHERLARVLGKLKPNLVIACYGMNDGIYYPFGNDRFAAFTNGILRLRQKVLASGAQIIHLTPPVFDPVPLKGKTLPGGLKEYRQPYEGYDDVLARYSDWLLSQRTNNWQVIDIHGPMKQALEAQRKDNPSFAFAGDGVHANAEGHLIMTQQILRAWKLDDSFEPKDHEELIRLMRKRQKLMSDAWLTEAGHLRPGMTKGLAIAEAMKQEAALNEQIRLCLQKHR